MIQKDLIETLIDDMPAENFCSYLFYSLFKKYGKGEIENCVYDTCHNHSLIFEVDKEKTAGIGGWFQIRDYGFYLDFSICKPNNREDYYIFPEMTLRIVGKIDLGVVIEDPDISIDGPEFEKYSLNNKGYKFDTNLFLLKVIQEDIFPLEGWLKKQIKALRTSVHY